MKVLLAVMGIGCTVMCLAVVAVIDLIARCIPALIAAGLLWIGWRVWQSRRRHPGPVHMSAPVPAPAPLPLQAPQNTEVSLVAGDHRGLRPPLTPLDSPGAVTAHHYGVVGARAGRVVARRRPGARVRP
jgi:hypothetical protein